MVIHSFIPFDQFAADSSGAYRAMEYDIIRRWIWMDSFWGFGVEPDWEMTKSFLGDYMIFSSDLGPLGVWFDLGLIGLGIYYCLLWKCPKPLRFLSPDYGWPLLLAGSLMTAYGCMAPLAMAALGGKHIDRPDRRARAFHQKIAVSHKPAHIPSTIRHIAMMRVPRTG